MKLYGGYVRVSRVGDRGDKLISPDDQEREMKRRAVLPRGAKLEMLPPELDRSGADDERPILLGAIERIERGELDGIVVYRLDRFTRSLASSVKLLERIEAAGGEVISATEPTNGDGSNLMRNIVLSIAEDERDKRAADFERSKADAIARGVYVGQAPLGYRKGKDRKLVPDPKIAPAIRDAFERRAAGESWRAVADRLGRRLGRQGMLPASVKVIIKNPAYMGVARQGKHVNPDAHDRIVSRALWEAAQIEHPRPPRGKHGTGLLIGLIRCTGCSKKMTSSVGPKGRVYRCRRHHAGGECPAPATIGAYIEPYVTEAVLAHLREGRVTYRQRGDAVAEAEAALEAAERNRDEIHKALDIAEVGAEHFAAAISDAAAEVEVRRRNLAEAHQQAPAIPDSADLPEVLEQLDADELRHVLRGALGVVWVAKGRGQIEQRVRIVARGFEPPDLSVRGIPSGPPVRFDFPEADLDGEVRPPGAKNLG